MASTTRMRASGYSWYGHFPRLACCLALPSTAFYLPPTVGEVSEAALAMETRGCWKEEKALR